MKAKIRVQFSVIVDGKETGESIEYIENVDVPEKFERVSFAKFMMDFSKQRSPFVLAVFGDAVLKFFNYNEVK